jgi:large subunit ribosomal protein L18
MGSQNEKVQARLKRKQRIRRKMQGTAEKPRLSVFRSAKHIYAQLIDDTCGKTVASASSIEKTSKEQPKFEDKKAQARFVGKLIGHRALENGYKAVVFDRNGFLYHGRVKAVSEGAREAGLDF